MRMHIVLCCAVAVAGCSKPKLESQVDVPTTLAGVRALADPPRVTVAVERVERYKGKGGFRCGHPVCLVVVPLVLWELAFPTKVDVVNVSEGGVVTYWLERVLHCRRSELLAAARRLHAGETVTMPFCEGLLKPPR